MRLSSRRGQLRQPDTTLTRRLEIYLYYARALPRAGKPSTLLKSFYASSAIEAEAAVRPSAWS
jgi:hypothetical protein